MNKIPQVMVFGSHSPQPGSDEYNQALELGRMLAEAGFDVASGGYGGIMEAVLKGAGEFGGGRIGYTSEIFPLSHNSFVSREIKTNNIFDRLQRMISDSDGFIVLKGGTGTLSELALTWELVNKKMVPYKPTICLGEFWRPVVEVLNVEPSIDNLRSLKPLSSSASNYIIFAEQPADAVRILKDELGK